MTDTIYIPPEADFTSLFEIAYTRWNRIIFSLVKRRVPNFDFDLARDICQQVWTEVWQGMVTGTYRYLSMSLLLLRADSRAIDYIRRSTRFPQLEDTRQYASPRVNRDRIIDYKKALAGAPEEERTVVSLNIHYGYTQEEIAARLGISSRTVRRRLANGERHLREFISGGGNRHAAK